MDPLAPSSREMQACGKAGSVLVFDSRLWHATAPNRTDRPRVGMAVRYAPWWLNLDVLMPGSDERKRMVEETGSRENAIHPITAEAVSVAPRECPSVVSPLGPPPAARGCEKFGIAVEIECRAFGPRLMPLVEPPLRAGPYCRAFGPFNSVAALYVLSVLTENQA